MPSDYAAARRLFQVMKLGGWLEYPETGGFRKGALWVSWSQAEDALRLADQGERVAGVAPASRVIERVTHQASNDVEPMRAVIVNPEKLRE